MAFHRPCRLRCRSAWMARLPARLEPAFQVQNTVVYLTKATAGAYTLAKLHGESDQQNTIVFISTTAAAHTITYTAGFYGNTFSSDVATFPATINACFTIKANQGTLGASVEYESTAGVTLG